MIRKTLSLSLFLLMVPLLSGCPTLPLSVGEGVLRGATMGPDGRIHLVFEYEGGIHYGTIDGTKMLSELVTSAGTVPQLPGGGTRDTLALGPQGNPHVLYYDEASQDLILVRKQAGEWNSYTVADLESSALSPSISLAVNSGGVVHMTYTYSTDLLGDMDVYYAKLQEGVLTVEWWMPSRVHKTSYLSPRTGSRFHLIRDPSWR